MKKQGLSHERGEPFPQDVSNADLEEFESEGYSGGPKLASESSGTYMQLDWSKSTKRSAWNTRALSILSIELHRLLKAGQVKNVPYDSKTMTLKYCEKQVAQRLDRIRRERLAHEENRLQEEKHRSDQTERRRGRRKSVRSYGALCPAIGVVFLTS